MTKKRVSVQIEGRSYAVITGEDEKYVQNVANEVTSRIRNAAQTSKHLDTRDCAVLAALDFCDDRNKERKKNKEIVGKADMIIQNTNELNRSCKEYKERLAEAINENTSLVRKIRELEEKVKLLTGENAELRIAAKNSQKQQQPAKPVTEAKTESVTGNNAVNNQNKSKPQMKQYSFFGNEDKNGKK